MKRIINRMPEQKLADREAAMKYVKKGRPLPPGKTLDDVMCGLWPHFQRRGRKMGKNDLWIAATAIFADARLLTTDRDFDGLDPLFLNRDWIAAVA